ncbi:SGNH/GDSL hydrolase family protein [Leuconostoc mesenteroides]|uniref:SGNH/GDSL hydrolase family protein n=1 Tax=Leuconostoc mesenteroides TaxID=1245 RepID=UPI00235FC971|nr:SGNH/GDSL hydrolase family protein [Leuconostoc mesenteroides]
MKIVDLESFLSPEWGKTSNGFVTTQFGAALEFMVQGAQEVTLKFAKKYDGLSLVLSLNGENWHEINVENNVLKLSVTDGHYILLVRSIAGNQMTLWTNPITLVSGQIDSGELAPIATNVNYITFIGDSITAGEEMIEHEPHPELSYPELIAEILHKPLARIGYGGSGLTPSAPFQEPTAVEALWHVAPNVERPRVSSDLVIVNYGTNDYNYGATVQDFCFGLRVYLLELIKRFHDAKIVLLVPFNGAFKKVFEQEIKRFDCFVLLDTTPWKISPQQVHPNILEHERVAKLLLGGLI